MLLEKETLDGETIKRLVCPEEFAADEEAAAMDAEGVSSEGTGPEDNASPPEEEATEADLAIPPLGLKSQKEGG